ncbi:DUF222 domain-containing protein [Gordonia sp. DT30]|uniref:HNH endonuclease signature motif containing protein n=1 Tax=Gordonia sp. DT30 TaxID=3416546 RepID=UPI003CEB5276
MTSRMPAAPSADVPSDVVESWYASETDADEVPQTVTAQLRSDEKLLRTDLVEIMAHSAATVAAGQFRMAQAASLIHDEHEEDYGCELAEALGEQQSTPEDFARNAEIAASGGDPRAEYGLDGLERAVVEVGAVLSIPPAQARALIMTGHAMRYRLPHTAAMLAAGRIDLRRFEIAVRRTELCSSDALPDIDLRLSEAIYRRDHMSTSRFTAMVDAIVAKTDKEAMKRRRERAQDDRGVTIRPDRFAPGQAKLTANLPTADGATVNARLDAMAAAVHKADPRTLRQRRADALVALGNGADHLECRCDDCIAARCADLAEADVPEVDPADADMLDADVPESVAPDADPPESDLPESDLPESDLPAATDSAATGTDETSEPCRCTCADHAPAPAAPPTTDPAPAVPAPSAVIHVVANQSTLDGTDDEPGYIDKFGVVDADTIREIAAAEFTRKVGLSPERAAEGLAGLKYRPGKKLQAFIRTGELSCCFPGCNNPAWSADLDHTTPYDHRHPDHGGTTTVHNIKPLCRLHHRAKTFNAWRDYQDTLGRAIFQSPSGHWFVGNAFRGTDLFGGLRTVPPKPPDHRARATIDTLYERLRTGEIRARDREYLRNPPPF